MSVQNKPDYKIFADGAKPGEVVTFPDISRGWGVTLDTTGGIPPMEFFNYFGKRIDEWLMYLTQRGIPEWDSSVDYPKSSMVMLGDVFYVSLKPTKNETPSTSQAAWRKFSDFFGIDGKLAKDQNGADIPNKPKFIENLGLDIALAGKQDKTSQLSIFATGSDVQILKLLGMDTALAGKQPKDTTLTDLSGKNIAQLLNYLGLAAAGNTSGNLALIGNTKTDTNKCAVIVKTGSNANGKYRIWSDGSIDMWGNGAANANGDALVNYPITLPAAAQNITTTPLELSNGTKQVKSIMVVTDLTTNTKATLIVKRSDGSKSDDGFYWSVNYAAF